MEKFLIVRDQLTKSKRFNLYGRKLEFRIKSVPSDEDPITWMKTAVYDILRHVTLDLKAGDKVGLTFCGKEFQRDPGWMNYQDVGNIKMSDVWEMISKIFQSNSEGLNTDTFCLSVTSIRMPIGKGRVNNYNDFNQECIKRRGIAVIKNKDNLCLPRAIVVAKAFADSDPNYRKIRRDTGKAQTVLADELLRNSKVNIPKEGGGIAELQKFQQNLNKEYKIVVYEYGSRGRKVLYEGPEGLKRLNLIYHKGHYNVIISLTAAFSCDYFCESCHVSYFKKYAHRCKLSCPCCQESPPCDKDTEILCEKCNRSFRGEDCLKRHLNKICEEVRRCAICLKTVKSDREHKCGEIFCKICQKHQSEPHYCHIQPDKKAPKTDNFLFVFYDLETRQDESYGENSQIHIPNLCVYSQRCHSCINETDLYFCQSCGYRLTHLKENIISNFMKFLLKISKIFRNVIVIAHNGQAFDHQFILRFILEETDMKPELIMRGSKILLMQIQNIKFIDSLNYFSMPLSALPQAFGLVSDKFKKGYFPHLFNTTANRDYVGPLPALEFYQPDSMKPETRQEFLEWYGTQKNQRFDFQEELLMYCCNDVRILAESCLKFRQIMLEQCNTCPFTEGCTIASSCNLVFRRNFLEPNTIGIIPKKGYRMSDNQSSIALKWLIYEEERRQVNIQHAAKSRETILNGMKVDGFCHETNQVFEFHGCYYHGHPACMGYNRDKALHGDQGDTLDSRYERTVLKTARLRNSGFEVVEMWECEFKSNAHLDNHPLLTTLPLNPRDAFLGGRTGNTKMYYKCKPGEKIKYIDVCSLYPWILKYGRFPIGHPRLYTDEKECSLLQLEKTSGLIKCTVLPPNNLYHPVLPSKMNNKLMFVLCRTCGQEFRQNPCCHSEEERVLHGTWVIEEVVKALTMGYKIMKIHEIWEYTVEQYDKDTKRGGLFTKMMDTFIKIKQQSSGWPPNCSTLEEKQKYIQEFLATENVQLEFDKIFKNHGMRTLSKLILNSFWGKFGQRENMPQTSIVHSPEEFFSLLSNPTINVNHISPVNNNTLVVNWVFKEEAADALNTVNVCVAAYTTAQARLKLYTYLERLGDKILYYDTDSVMYVHREGEYEPEVGNCIGEMTDELEQFGPNTYITEFLCGGPKSYAFKIFPQPPPPNSDTVCKIKGIRLNWSTSQLVNFDSLKDLIWDNSEDDKFLVVTDEQIRRTKDHNVITTKQRKIYTCTANKRRFMENYDSYPYGHKRLLTS